LALSSLIRSLNRWVDRRWAQNLQRRLTAAIRETAGTVSATEIVALRPFRRPGGRPDEDLGSPYEVVIQLHPDIIALSSLLSYRARVIRDYTGFRALVEEPDAGGRWQKRAERVYNDGFRPKVEVQDLAEWVLDDFKNRVADFEAEVTDAFATLGLAVGLLAAWGDYTGRVSRQSHVISVLEDPFGHALAVLDVFHTSDSQTRHRLSIRVGEEAEIEGSHGPANSPSQLAGWVAHCMGRSGGTEYSG